MITYTQRDNCIDAQLLTSLRLWTAQEQDPMAEFERIFSKFSTAEELTGAAAPDGDDEADGAAEQEDGDGAIVKASLAFPYVVL